MWTKNNETWECLDAQGVGWEAEINGRVAALYGL